MTDTTWTPLPVPGPVYPAHTPTPVQYTVGSIRRAVDKSAVAVRVSHASFGSMDWGVATINYGAYYASWDDISTPNWEDVNPGFLIAEGNLSAATTIIYMPQLSGTGRLAANVRVLIEQPA